MKGNFKRHSFDKNVLNAFVYDLQAADLAVESIWKKNNKVLSVENEAVNRLDVQLKGKTIFRMIGNQGTYNDSVLSETENEMVLKLMVKYHFYTEPNWGLGIGLTALYVVFFCAYPFFASYAWASVLYPVCGLTVLGFLFLAYRNSVSEINKTAFSVVQIIGAIAYILTALASLLALPLYRAILYNNLYHRAEAYFEDGEATFKTSAKVKLSLDK